jgi:hypothetical protein
MVRDARPIYGTLVFLGALLAALFAFQPYSADWPGRRYTEPARRYLRAATRQDSAALRRLSAAEGPVRWALATARRRPDVLKLWNGRLEAFAGEHRGDTTEVFVYPYYPYPLQHTCEDEPIVLRFVSSPTDVRVVAAGSECLDRS